MQIDYQLNELKEVVCKWFYVEDDRFIDVTVGVYIANKFSGDPLWMLLVAPPSNTKTEMLRAFEDHPDAVFVSSLTPSTLVSGMKIKNIETSLLPQLNNKFVVLKDFTTVLSMRSEQQQEVLSQLREAYDGQYSAHYGNAKKVIWKGKFGLIAAVTPVYDCHYRVIGQMGERFLLYRTDSVNGLKMGIQAQKNVGQEDIMRAEIRDALHRFVDQFQGNLEGVPLQDEAGDMIIALSCFAAIGRCPVKRSSTPDRCILYDPVPEGPARLVKQLTQLGTGVALAYGKDIIDSDVYKTLKKVGRDLIPSQRLRIIHFLWEEMAVEHNAFWSKTKEIAEGTNMPTTTAKLILEDFMTIGALRRDTEASKGGKAYRWQIAQHMSELIGMAEVFDE